MGNSPTFEGIEIPGLAVRRVAPARVGSIRFFEPSGEFIAGLAGVVGGPLPRPLQAEGYAGRSSGSDGAGLSGAGMVLAGRSPSETLILCAEAGQFAAVEAYAAGRSDGCVVDQTGGLWVWSVSGEKAADLTARLGSPESMPAPGEARTGRFAELSVLSLCIRAGEILLIVDRLHSGHLTDWISVTAADL